jgi:hypothetical protein
MLGICHRPEVLAKQFAKFLNRDVLADAFLANEHHTNLAATLGIVRRGPSTN